MKRLILLVMLFAASISCFAKPTAQSLDQIVAIVNDDVVTRSELNRNLSIANAQLSAEGVSRPSANVVRKQVLDQLINKKLQLQIAKQAGVQVSDTELNQAIENIAKQNSMSVDALYERLNQEGMTTPAYRKEIRDQMTIQRLQQQEVAGRVSISNSEIDNFIRSRKWQKIGSNQEYQVEDILVALPEGPSTQQVEQAKTLALSISDKIKTGTTYQEAIRVASSANPNVQAGDLGWRKLSEMPSAFIDPVTQLKLNQVSAPIQTANGFHVVYVLGLRDSEKPAPPSRKEAEQLLLQQKFEQAVQTWVSKLRHQAFIVTEPNA